MRVFCSKRKKQTERVWEQRAEGIVIVRPREESAKKIS
jgi:hypothetical protein